MVTVTTKTEAPVPVRLLLAVAACGSVLPLLGWVMDLGGFAMLTAGVAVPLLAALVAAAIWLDRTGRWPGTRAAMTAGALGGVLGTLGYDLFRVPFVVGGLQLLAPIDSYGVLLLAAEGSTPWTGLAGWSYHVVNGVGFGVALAVVARHRHWGWGILWAMVLETATVVSPFATTYALRDADGFRVLPILLAYAAHVPYGIAIGVAAARADRVHDAARSLVRAPVASGLALVAIGLATWQGVVRTPTDVRAGLDLADGPSAIVTEARLRPAWIRLAPDDCLEVQNRDDIPRTLDGTDGVRLEAGQRTRWCPPDAPEVRRVKVDDEPFSGGWLIIDSEA